MTQHLDATILDAWTEFIALRERGVIEDLDEKCRNIIFAVAAAEARGETINQISLLKTLKPKSQLPILSRVNALIRNGWLRIEKDTADRRMKNLRLTEKSMEMVNLLSASIRTVVKRSTGLAVCVMTWLMDFQSSDTYLLASQVLAV